jgi:DNA primase large subunit
MDLLKYYSRKDVQKAIYESSINREIAVKFGDKGFGKRPDILQFGTDVYELVKQGATSFNISEERWQDPLLLKIGMTKKQLDDLRIGWDLLLDIDGLFEYSKIAAYLVIEALKFHNVKSYSIKFSGNKGFHILVPFETFPSTLNNLDTKILFPECARIVANYLKHMIKDHLLDNLSKNLPNVKDEKFDIFSLVDIDSIAISSRHMFRAPYSYNEKSGLISIPIEEKSILNFDKENAKIENVETNLKFFNLENINQGESSQLLIQAYDWFHKTKKHDLEEVQFIKKHYEQLSNALDLKYFPPCILNGLKGMDDGKKRFLFVLLNFLKNVGYNDDNAKKIIYDWNKKNKEPLRENYINAQLTWQKKQKNILPQNCPTDKENIINNQDNVYVSLGICKPDNLCKLIKNPVNYTIRKSKFKN